MRNNIRDAMMMHGERAILLSLFHAGDADAVPCAVCGDDLYKSPEMDCTNCYGTMFAGGVRYAMIVWSIFTDRQDPEQLEKQGIWRMSAREAQFEAFPRVREHDTIIRVKTWTDEHTPGEVDGYYMLQNVTQRSLRAGNHYGQDDTNLVAQKAQITELGESMKGITLYPIVGNQFNESIQLTPATAVTPAQAVLEPDVKVIYFPFEEAPGGVEPDTGPTGGGLTGGLVFTQTIPANVWTIHHTLGYDPAVSIIVDDQEVDADVSYPNTSIVIITFNTPQAGEARLT